MRRLSNPALRMMARQGDAGYSSTPWDVDTTDPNSITWSTETFATNQNANAIRYGTLYNFRFDADQGPNPTTATVGYFKTGSPMGVSIQAPGGVPSPSPTPTPTPTATATANSNGDVQRLPPTLRRQLQRHQPQHRLQVQRRRRAQRR